MERPITARAGGPACAVVSLWLAACAPSDPTGGERHMVGATGAAGGVAGMSAQAGTGAADGSFGNPTGGAPAGVPVIAPVMTPDGGECGATSVQAQQVVVMEEVEVMEEVTSQAPVAIYLMFDQSGSMILLWPGAVNGINAFVNDPNSAGIDVGIQYFPLFEEGCDGSVYAAPEVPPGRLPAHAAMISNSLSLHAPFGSGTPIEGALRGATQFCSGFQATNPEEKCVAVLITDGAPSGCNEDFAQLAQIAADAFAADVLTYAVGLLGSDFTLLNDIAMSGGAMDCDPGANFACDITASSDLLVDALNQIRDTVTTIETHIETVTTIVETPLECEWQIPPSPAGSSFDREKVNVQLSSAAGEVTLGKVASEAECAQNGWRYDDPSAPTRIVACEQTCDLIQSTAQAKVDILLGCRTVPLQ
jgi:hypothetical protein